MYEYIQVAAKCVIIAAILIVAGFASLRVWRADLNLRELISPSRALDTAVSGTTDWIPTRDQNTIYQNGKPVARASQFEHDRETNRIYFPAISKSEDLEERQEFEYRQWKLRLIGYRSVTGNHVTMIDSKVYNAGRLFEDVECEIVGTAW